MYAIAGATGNTGGVAAAALLDANEPVRAWVTREEKGRAWRERGAEVAVVDLTDPSSVAAGLEGARGAYLLLPPNAGRGDGFLAAKHALTDAIVAGIARSQVEHVVFLSSMGAQHAEGTGMIRTVHYAEGELGALGRKTTFLRPAYFMENWGRVVAAVKGDGVLPQMLGAADREVPMVATRDIGRTAAAALRDGTAGIIELEGPERYSPRDVAAAFGALLGREIQVVDVPFEAQIATFTRAGLPEDFAALFREMNEGIYRGQVAFDGAGRHVKGTVRLREALAPLLG